MTFCEVWVAGGKGASLPPDEWLPAAERQRLAQVTDATTRRASSTGQALLRAVLARRLGTSPAQVPLLRHCPHCDSRQHGPLLLPGSGLSVSVAHSGPCVVAAVSDADAVGVDVERLGPSPQPLPELLLDVVLSPGERERLPALPDAGRERAFRQWWTRKEAVLKACGDGVLGPLTDVRLSPLTGSRFLARWPTGPGGRPYWVSDLDLGSDTVGSVCLAAETTTMTISGGDVVLREELHRWQASGRVHGAPAGHSS